jgi:topoisomerase-4 subunit B
MMNSNQERPKDKKKNSTHYDAQQIEVLEGLEPVRRRPGMYTDTSTPFHLLQEVIDNSVDEALSGYASTLEVIILEDGSMSVLDNGRGMPIDMHAQHQRPGIELILSTLHSGAKFSQQAYGYSGGLHGVGVSVVNALSSLLQVDVYREYKHYRIVYEDGVLRKPLYQLAKQSKIKNGTKVHFSPNHQFFERNHINPDQLARLLKTKALLCPGLTIHLTYKDYPVQSWSYPRGLMSYISSLSFDQPLWLEPWNLSRQEAEFQIDVIVQWARDQYLNDSFVNLIPTVQGGTHVLAFRAGLLEAIREYTKMQGREPRDKISGEDMGIGMNFILSIKMHDPNFIGQTKEKLSSSRISQPIMTLIKNSFLSWLLKHFEQANALLLHIDKIQENRMLKDQAKQLKKNVQIKFPAKLADCISKHFEEREIYFVEGDSAGSSAKQARDKRFQSILPLRGKILNSWEVKSHKIYESQEVKDIILTLGVEPMSDDLSRLRYNRICFLADADSDGSHIVTLLCALFVQHFPALVRAGHIYVAQPPLFRLDIGKQHFYLRSEQEKENLLAQHKGKAHSLIRFKGLGEMNPAQLRSTTLDPQSRILMRLNYDEAGYESLDLLMAKSRASDRKKWLEEPTHANFPLGASL